MNKEENGRRSRRKTDSISFFLLFYVFFLLPILGWSPWPGIPSIRVKYKSTSYCCVVLRVYHRDKCYPVFHGSDPNQIQRDISSINTNLRLPQTTRPWAGTDTQCFQPEHPPHPSATTRCYTLQSTGSSFLITTPLSWFVAGSIV